VSAVRDVECWGEPLDTASLAVLAVHGRGQDPGYVRAVAERVDLPGVAWVGPAAAGGSWYPNRFTEPRATNEPQLSAALEVVDGVLAGLAQDGFAPERVVLLGFSQGACLLADHLIRGPRRYAAAVLLTGGFIGPPGFRPQPAGDLAGTPVLLATSELDDWVPVERVRQTADLLRELGGDVTLRIDDDPEHHVNDAAVAAVRELLTRLAGSNDEGAHR
jgi:phospholipase/carboxylesterase